MMKWNTDWDNASPWTVVHLISFHLLNSTMKRYKYIWLCLCYAATLCGCKDDSILRYDEAMDSVYF